MADPTPSSRPVAGEEQNEETVFPFPEQDGEAPEHRFLRVLATNPELRAELGRTLWLRENGLRTTHENVEQFARLPDEDRVELERRAVAECEAFAVLCPQEQTMLNARALVDQLAANDAHAKASLSALLGGDDA